MPLDRLWDLIDKVVPRSELRAAVALIGEVAPPGVNPEAEWQAALCARPPLARKFIKILAETIEFGATADAAKILIALQGLPALLEANPSERVPTTPARPRSTWYRRGGGGQVLTAGRPPAGHTVDRAGYTFCVLSQFHTRLKRRDIFAAASSRWAGPRAKLLAGEQWEAQGDRQRGLADLHRVGPIWSAGFRPGWWARSAGGAATGPGTPGRPGPGLR